METSVTSVALQADSATSPNVALGEDIEDMQTRMEKIKEKKNKFKKLYEVSSDLKGLIGEVLHQNLCCLSLGVKERLIWSSRLFKALHFSCLPILTSFVVMGDG